VSDIHLKPSSGTDPGTLIAVDPIRAGWNDICFEVWRLLPMQKMALDTSGNEALVVVLGGRGAVEVGSERFEVGERANVFEGRAHAVYLPPKSKARIIATGGMEVAVAMAPATRSLPARHIRPQDVEVEARGDGNASRTIHHVLPPEADADKLMVVEVFTPSGNWSSYPPHKHDVHAPPKEHDLEEIYYYRIDRPEGFAIQRVYTDDRRVDETLTVRDGELVLVREGYHPVVAAPGCNVYYLNVLSGSGRSMAATDDPALAWVRGTWKTPQRKIT
jgi:5-deoxy-glucuronate isomerase